MIRGKIESYGRGRKKRWKYYCGKKHRCQGFLTREEAERALRKVEARLADHGGILPDEIPFKDLADSYETWMQTNLAASTHNRRGFVIRVRLVPFFDCTARQVNFARVEEFKSVRMKDGISCNTLNNELKVLEQVLRHGVELGYLLESELPRIKRLKPKKRSITWLRPEEVKRILMHARPDVRRRLKFAFTTGLRKSEFLGIKMGDVRLDRREVLIRDPKNGQDRVTHLSAPAYSAVHEQVQYRLRNGAGPGDYLFPGRKKEEPMKDIRGGLDGALKRARLPHIRVHDMRATFASLLAAGGADVKSLCDAMGWKDLNSAKPYLATVREAMKRHVDNVGKMLTWESDFQ